MLFTLQGKDTVVITLGIKYPYEPRFEKDVDSAKFARFLQQYPSVTKVSFFAIPHEQDYDLVVPDAIHNEFPLLVTHLKANKSDSIGKEGFAILVDVLMAQNRLTSLNCTNLKLGDDGLKIIMRLLANNSGLAELSLKGNEMTDHGTTMLIGALKAGHTHVKLDLRGDNSSNLEITQMTHDQQSDLQSDRQTDQPDNLSEMPAVAGPCDSAIGGDESLVSGKAHELLNFLRYHCPMLVFRRFLLTYNCF